MNRKPNFVSPLLAAAAAIIGILAVAGSLPLASRMTALISRTMFSGTFFGPALAQLLLLLLGCAAFGIALHRGLRLRSQQAEAAKTGR